MRLPFLPAPLINCLGMLFIFFLILSLPGCVAAIRLAAPEVVTWDFPVTPVEYAQKDKINLRVELRLTEEFSTGHFYKSL
jgi:hypothetical protein